MARSEVPAWLRRSGPRLIGRENELQTLIEAVSSPPVVAVIYGEAGVGKTRLVRELARDGAIGGTPVLVGHCHQVREQFPLGAVIDALRVTGGEWLRAESPLLGALRPLLPEWAQHLPLEPERLPDPRAERHRFFRALRDVFEALGRTVCVLEDVHRADEETLEFLSFLTIGAPSELALVLTCRSPNLGPSPGLIGVPTDVLRPTIPTATIDLGPLSVREVRALVAAELGTNIVSWDFATRLHQWTAGIPFAVEEVVHLLRDRRELGTVRECPVTEFGQLAVPRAFRESILRRLGPLSEDARLIVWAAAVLGTPADEHLLITVAGLRRGCGGAAIVECLLSRVLQEQESGTYGFRHRLAAQAAYGTVPGPSRRRLHLRAAKALERRGQPRRIAEIARHLKEGGAETWPLYAEAAAKDAMAAGDDRLAARLLEEALSASRVPRAARIRMSLALGEAALYCPPSSSVVRILTLALEEEGLPTGVRGELRYSLSRLLGQAGDALGWRREAERAVTELRRRPALGVRAMINLAQPLWQDEVDLGDHLAWLERAVQTSARHSDRSARIAVAGQRAAILLSLGDPRGWAAIREIPRTTDSVEEKLQLLRGYHSISIAALGLGHYARAEYFLDSAQRLHDQLARRWWGLWLEAARTSLAWFSGRWEGLEERLRRLLEQTGETSALTDLAQITLGSLLLAEGELDEADYILGSALATAARTHGLAQFVTVSGRLARLRLDRDDPHGALEVGAAALAAVRCKRVWVLGRVVAPEVVQALVVCEKTGAAREIVAEFAAGLRGLDAPAARAALASCRGALAEADGRHAAARGHFQRSEDRWGRLSNRYEAARARSRRASCGAVPAGAAGSLLLSALNTFRDLGAQGDVRRARTKLKAQGLWRGGRLGYGEELSPREAEVAELAGMGRTNREIAAALFISPRTVEVHVAAALRKLDLRSRHELRVWTREAGQTKDT